MSDELNKVLEDLVAQASLSSFKLTTAEFVKLAHDKILELIKSKKINTD